GEIAFGIHLQFKAQNHAEFALCLRITKKRIAEPKAYGYRFEAKYSDYPTIERKKRPDYTTFRQDYSTVADVLSIAQTKTMVV
ncbi:hypothetical protein, partial [Flavobacterium sp. GCM10023249]|uniref:hypothetical protein n=1 Tax=unclassified Flavobacterium TaxID=196869 RepID=UPI003611D303